MKNVSVLFLLSMLAFFGITAATARIGTDFSAGVDVYGWPNEIARITYQNLAVADININGLNIFINFSLCFSLIACVRVLFLMMKVKRKSTDNASALKSHPYFHGNKL
jgi:hypothetical protein